MTKHKMTAETVQRPNGPFEIYLRSVTKRTKRCFGKSFFNSIYLKPSVTDSNNGLTGPVKAYTFINTQRTELFGIAIAYLET